MFTAVPELDESVSFQVGIPGAESSEEKAKLMGEDIRTCEFCQRTGPARTFYSATKRFCTVGCCHRFSASHQVSPEPLRLFCWLHEELEGSSLSVLFFVIIMVLTSY